MFLEGSVIIRTYRRRRKKRARKRRKAFGHLCTRLCSLYRRRAYRRTRGAPAAASTYVYSLPPYLQRAARLYRLLPRRAFAAAAAAALPPASCRPHAHARTRLHLHHRRARCACAVRGPAPSNCMFHLHRVCVPRMAHGRWYSLLFSHRSWAGVLLPRSRCTSHRAEEQRLYYLCQGGRIAAAMHS